MIDTDYEKQAQDFLDRFAISFKAKLSDAFDFWGSIAKKEAGGFLQRIWVRY